LENHEKTKRQLWTDLWQDDRSYVRRLLLAAFPCFLIAFTYLIWGPFDTYYSNSQFFDFTFGDIVIPFLLLGFAGFAVAAAVAALFKGRIFNWIVCIIFGLAIASYIQGMFLNLNLGILDGTAIAWQNYSVHSIINIGVWFLIILVPFTVHYFFRNVWEKVVRVISLALTSVQLVALVAAIISSPVADTKTQYYLSGDEQYTVSANDNVIVFILDYFSNAYLDSVLQEYPDALDAFHDFTYYSNTDCSYHGTYPSLNHMLTGIELDTTITTAQWLEQSWSSEKASNFYGLLAANDYKVNIYSNVRYLGKESMLGKVSNLSVVDTETEIQYRELIKKMVNISCYKYMPHAFKAGFWMDTNDFSDVVHAKTTTTKKKDESAFYKELKRSGLVADEQSNYFVLQHLRGAHPAYNVDENGKYFGGATREQAIRGYFRMVEEYLRQMKDLGVYDDATIIITADHGDRKNPQVIYFIKEPGVTHDTMPISAAPISHKDFMPTILANIGEDYSAFGPSIYDIGENNARERTMMIYRFNKEYPAVPKHNSNTTGSSNVFCTYPYVGNIQDLLDRIAEGPTQILPMTDWMY
jgi:hypothetical protein